MDSAAQNALREMMRKEHAFLQRIEKQNEARYAEAEKAASLSKSTSEPQLSLMTPPKKYITSTQHFLGQSLGLVESPHLSPIKQAARERSLDPTELRRGSKELLYFGVSSEGEGRKAYLKSRSHKGPQERFGRQVTEASVVGWTAPSIRMSNNSPFAHKPLIEGTFYRVCGVPLAHG